MSGQRVKSVFALAMGFAIAGCWCAMSGVVVSMALTALRLSPG
jgi:hypothetical protein